VADLWPLHRIRAELGDEVAVLAARVAVRQAPDGEPYLADEELERLLADDTELTDF
jgi:hypothetical protein